MPYTYHTDDDRKAMLDALGLASEDELVSVIPEKHRVRGLLPIERGKTEPETLRKLFGLSETNNPAARLVSFLGGGVYDHTVPSVVKNIASRPEFATAYTPYQPEASQGTLQVIFEFQTHVARLTRLPIANASMYDGASALAEACLMAAKITRREIVLVPHALNPRYRRVLESYVTGQKIEIRPVPASDAGDVDLTALRGMLDDKVAAVVVQTPNYFGALERPWEFEKDVHAAGALLVASVDPVSLSLLKPPGEWGADIAVGECQPLGNDVSFGGPLVGFMACRTEFIRQMPGRIVSATHDIEGRPAFVLTLQTREQHIRREKATSNICTNQGLLATRATVYLSLLGEHGFTELGRVCHERARKLADAISACEGYSLRYRAPYFREFVVACPTDADAVVTAARAEGILAGVPLSRYFGAEGRNLLLVAVTEKHQDDDFEKFCAVLKRAAMVKVG
ncbi:MAG TPA: aminomethyl-transferring glycine dehydrogenase subunit GcvPA [Candidatus Krumholzibacteria bacterium]|nr:aminomethyl-transferring glycine dehydrogenase subunit GcvPA [Candidatus Krumholzibacteria bacterium]